MGRHGAVTFKGNPLTLVGEEVKVGAAAPEFTLTGDAMQDIRKADLLGKPTIISVVPSPPRATAVRANPPVLCG